jgi:hypothetical protein
MHEVIRGLNLRHTNANFHKQATKNEKFNKKAMIKPTIPSNNEMNRTS